MKTHALLLAAALLSASAQAATLPDEALKCFDWFATLGFPDVKEAKWAEVWFGQWYSFGGDSKPQAQTIHGFVIKEGGDDFTVLSHDLAVRELKKTKPGIAPHERITFEERPFLQMIHEQLKALRNPTKEGFHRFRSRLGHKTEVFSLSNFCWRRGEADLAAELYAEAEKLETHLRHTERKKEATGMREALEIELGHAAMWDAVLRMGGGSLSGNTWGGNGTLQPRAEVLEAFRRIVRMFPHCEHIARAKATIAVLERMVAEDAKHPSLTQQQIDQLPLEKRIAELIWRLRDQNGHQMGQPGWCDVFGYRDEKTAAHQLLEIGYPAAPALIEALTDDRFSRSVGFHRDFHFSHTILTIGDCAQQILSRMTGQNLYASGSTSGYMSNEDKMFAVQKAARVWWDEYQKKGLTQMLVDTISAGKTSPRSLVVQLKSADPSSVEAAVLAGASKATEDWMVRQFIEVLDSLNSPKCTEALAELMKEHGKIEVRLDAAALLLNRNDPDVLSAVLHEWATYQSSKESFDDPFEAMADILACHGSERAVQALVTGWDERSPGQRLKIVEKIGECMKAKPREYGFDSRAKPRPATPQAAQLAIALLAHALEDTETHYGISGGSADLPYGEASIGDFALNSLHQINAAKYPFTSKASRRQRESERIRAANLWRKEHGQPLLPSPPPPGPELPPAQALRIVRVTLLPPDKSEAAEIAKKAQSLKGTDFVLETIPQLLLWFAQSNFRDLLGLDIEASRENDLTGVELILRIHLGKTKADQTANWQISHGGRAGEKPIGNSSGSSSQADVIKPGYWDDFQDSIREALNQPPQTEFRIHAGLKRP